MTRKDILNSKEFFWISRENILRYLLTPTDDNPIPEICSNSFEKHDYSIRRRINLISDYINTKTEFCYELSEDNLYLLFKIHFLTYVIKDSLNSFFASQTKYSGKTLKEYIADAIPYLLDTGFAIYGKPMHDAFKEAINRIPGGSSEDFQKIADALIAIEKEFF